MHDSIPNRSDNNISFLVFKNCKLAILTMLIYTPVQILMQLEKIFLKRILKSPQFFCFAFAFPK